MGPLGPARQRTKAVRAHYSPGLQRNVDAIAKVEAAVKDERTPGDRLGRYLIRHTGRPASVALHLVALIGWAAWNTVLAPGQLVFDTPAFPLLSLIASCEGILLGLLILSSQNRLQHEAAHAPQLANQHDGGNRDDEHASHAGCALPPLRPEIGIEDIVDDLKAETDPERIAERLKRSMPAEE